MIKKLWKSVSARCHNIVCSHRDEKTNRQIVVFESDDWGAIRVPNKKVWTILKTLGYAVESRPYERYDTLELDEDIRLLRDLLLQFNDSKGKHPKITMNYLCANPNFELIRKADFKDYYYESIKETYQHHLGSENVIDLVKTGIIKGVFQPQCHGREHYNVCEWLKALQLNDVDVTRAFELGMCGIFPKENPSRGNKYMVALRHMDRKSTSFVLDAVQESLNLFKELWGSSSSSFVAPCYTLDADVEDVLAQNGVKLIQTSRVQRHSVPGKLTYRYSGERNRNGLTYSIRNCYFEPSTSKSNTVVEDCLKQIALAFQKNKVAVISTHRINFVSGLDTERRNQNLQMLRRLLKEILAKYPDVEFLSSDELCDIYKN